MQVELKKNILLTIIGVIKINLSKRKHKLLYVIFVKHKQLREIYQDIENLINVNLHYYSEILIIIFFSVI